MKNQILLRYYNWRFAFKHQGKKTLNPILKKSPKILGIGFVIFTLLLPSFVSFISLNQVQASTWYDSGWINVSSSRFHADDKSLQCPSIGQLATLMANYRGQAFNAWVNLNTPEGNYKIDMKLGYSHKIGTPPQTDETIRLYTRSNLQNTTPPATYADKANVPDMGDSEIDPSSLCSSLANSIHTYTNVANRKMAFPNNGDLFLQGTGSSVIVKAIRVYGDKVPIKEPKLIINKEVNKATANPGETIAYTLTYKNTGNVKTTNTIVKDPFSNQNQNYLTFLSSSPSPKGGTIDTWEIGSLNPCEQKTIQINAKISNNLPAGATTIIKNRGNINSTQTSLLYSNYVQTEIYVPTTNPNLSISKLGRNLTRGTSSWKNTVYAEPGDEIEFSIEVSSTGDVEAKDVHVRDYLPSKMDYVSGSTHGAVSGGVTSSWLDIGDIDEGDSKTIYFSAEVYEENHFSTGSTTLTNRGKTYCDDVDTLSDTADVIVEKGSNPDDDPDLSISKLGRNLTRGTSSWKNTVYAEPGDEIEFSIEVSSTGDVEAKDVHVRDYLPSKMDYVSGSTHGAVSGDVTSSWLDIGDIDEGDSKTIYFSAEVYEENHFSTGSTTLTNRGKTYCDDVDTLSDTADVIVEKGSNPDDDPDLSISKLGRNLTRGTSSWKNTVYAEPGDEIEFSIEVSSTGDVEAKDVHVRDYLPSKMDYVSGSTHGAVSGDVTSSWLDIGDIDEGDSKTIYFSAEVYEENHFSTGSTTLTNRGKTYCDDVDTLSDTADVIVEKGSNPDDDPDLSISKLGRNLTRGTSSWKNTVYAEPGDEIEFSIEVSSTGDVEAKDVHVRDYLPSKMDYVSGSTHGAVSGDVTSSWLDIGDIDEGDSKTIYFSAEVYEENHFSTGSTTLTNRGKTYCDDVDTLSDTADVIVEKGSNPDDDPDLSISKLGRNLTRGTSSWKNTVYAEPGDEIEFSIEVSSTGDVEAKDVHVRDYLPSKMDYVSGSTHGAVSGDVTSSWLDIGDIDEGDSKTIYFSAEVYEENHFSTGSTTLTNRGKTYCDDVDTLSDTADVIVEKGSNPDDDPDLSISKLGRNLTRGTSSWKNTVYAEPGDEIEFSIEVSSTGDVEAKDVHVRDYLPSKMDYVSGSTHGAVSGDVTSSWLDIGDIDEGDSKTIYFSAEVYEENHFSTGSTTLTNRGKTYCDDVDTLSDTADVIVEKGSNPDDDPDLSISKLGRNLTRGTSSWKNTVYAEPGDEIEFSIEVSSTGDVEAKDVHVRDYLPSKMDYVSGSTHGAVSGDVTSSWLDIGDIDEGDSKTIYFSAEVYEENHFSTGSTTLTNRGKTYCDDVDTLSDTADVIVEKGSNPDDDPDLSISKLGRNLTRGTSSWKNTVYAEPGDEIEFSIEVSSTGDVEAKDVHVRDYLPSKMDYVSGSTHGAVSGDVTSSWLDIGDIDEGDSKTIYFSAEVYEENYFSTGSTTLTNRGKTYCDDVDTLSDTARVVVTKGSNPPIILETEELSINKLARNISAGQVGFSQVTLADPEDVIEFSIDIANAGDTYLKNIKTWDVLPAEFTYLDGTCSVDGSEVGDGISGAGLMLGNFSINEKKLVKFQASLASSTSFAGGTTNLVNYGYATSDETQDISDTAVVTITKGTVLGATTIQTGPAETFALSLIISFLISIAIYFIIKKEEEVKAILRKLGVDDEKIAKFYSCLKLKLTLLKLRIKEIKA